ncbi:30S ribosomal protein S8 [Planctomycetota bacterium]
MSLSDPIADMLTRIRNGYRSEKDEVTVKASRICEGIAGVLKAEGYVREYDRIDDGKQGLIRIQLKYDMAGTPVITEIKRSSRPGRRLYASAKELPVVLGGLGVAIVSTSQGVLSDRNCRQANVGGEVLCTVS